MTSARDWTRDDSAALLRAPTADDDKYTRGVVAVRTGSLPYPGAAVLGVEGAWRAGAGMVRFLGAAPLRDAVLARRPETVTGEEASLPRADSWVVGSGTDPARRTAGEAGELRALLTGGIPVVVDAGALDLVQAVPAPLVLTPHDGEFARLSARLGLPTPGAEASARVRETIALAEALGVVVLRKGALTIAAAPGEQALRVGPATPWLSTAGTGDVLAGAVGAIVAGAVAGGRTPDPGLLLRAAATAAWLHADAGRRAAGPSGRPIVALDVASQLPFAVEAVLAS